MWVSSKLFVTTCSSAAFVMLIEKVIRAAHEGGVAWSDAIACMTA
jgi:hypothetical protein